MSILARKNEVIVVAFQRGYRVEPDTGTLFSPGGKPFPIDKKRSIHIHYEGAIYSIRVARLVVYGLYGILLTENLQIHYLDEDKTNLKPSNLYLKSGKNNLHPDEARSA